MHLYQSFVLNALGSVGKNGLKIVTSKVRIAFENLGFRPSFGKQGKNKIDRNARAVHYRFAAQNFRVSMYVVVPVHDIMFNADVRERSFYKRVACCTGRSK